ncbi:hypothetical protein L1987_43533 [Smallanthus sonchifolius]|uniref:Uncharacterized protein n=1 Tax=Smallanthus sonchifolius TaxID=185202 RepID=A0ACB9GLC7_9ASTR|nr:hypothetical protein L1987_43533 [Smallanthus sonchifolius]
MSNPLPVTNNATVITIPARSCRRSIRFLGAKPIPLAISVSIGLIICFAIPKPIEVSKQAWRLLAIFLTTIAGLILGPLPVGAWAFVCLMISVLTKTLPFEDVFAAFTNEVIWQEYFGLAYGLAICEAIISPAMPSATAKAGGIFLPIINSLAIADEVRPKESSARKLGAYLIRSQFQSCSSTTALFLTAAAQNMLCIKLAKSLGVKIKSPWVAWFKASCFPGLASLMLTPFIIYKMFPPETKHTAEHWLKKTRANGSSQTERVDHVGNHACHCDIMDLWRKSRHFKCGCSDVRFISPTDTWIGWHVELLILQSVYFFIHYLFAGQTAHVGALYSAFLSMHLRAKVPATLSALLLSYNTNLFGALTHCSSGQAAVYYRAGYVKLSDVFKLGILMAVINLTIWGSI